MHTIRSIIAALLLAALSACSSHGPGFLTGVDANYTLDMQRAGRTWSVESRTADPLVLLHDAGTEAIRLRLWTGDTGTNGLADTTALAHRAEQLGMQPYLVLFLSENWADFVKQPVPEIWRDLNTADRLAAIEAYARRVAQHFADAGVRITTYEIGNEIDFGICGQFEGDWAKRVSRVYLEQDLWPRMIPIILAAERGVRSVDPNARFILHLAQWQDADFCIAFFRFMLAHGVQLDYCGLSYFPSSADDPAHRRFAFIDEQVNTIAAAVERPVIICESAYPSEPHFAGQFADWNKPAAGYSLTPKGQQHWLHDYLQWARTNPHIAAAYYWSPEWYASDMWHAFSLFDQAGRAKPALQSLR